MEVASETQEAVASCTEGTHFVSGGGSCDNTLLTFPVQWQVGQIQSSLPVLEEWEVRGWEVTCRIGHATAVALCCERP